MKARTKRRKLREGKLYFFTVIELETGKKVGEYRSFPAIPTEYCNEKHYKITYRTEESLVYG